MFGQDRFGENIYGQADDDRELILLPWVVQCPTIPKWGVLKEHQTTVEFCANPKRDEDEEIVIPPTPPPPSE